MQTQTAKDDLAQTLVPLVHEVAAQVARRVPSHVLLDDLVGAGMLGLAGALTRFDPERVETFKGYAEFRIRGAIIDDLRRRDIMSRDARIESKKLQLEIQKLSGDLGHEAEDDEIAEHLGISLDTYRGMQLRLKSARLVSAENIEIEDRSDSPYDAVKHLELRRRLVDGIRQLPERQRHVLWMYYFQERPLREIAEVFDVTPSRVCQIRSESVKRLRQMVFSTDAPNA